MPAIKSSDAAPATPVPRNRAVIFVSIAVLGCALDLATKSWIFAKLGMPFSGHEPIFLIGSVFSLTTSLNEGALFGFGQGQVFWFAGLSVLAAMAVVYWLFWAGAAHDLWLTVALGCIMAGIFGNLYDRVGLPGLHWDYPATRQGMPVFAVRDWLHFEIKGVFDWPVFNLADSLLVCGAIMLLWHAFGLSTSKGGADAKKTSENSRTAA